MAFLQKHRLVILLLCVLFAVYLFTRLYNILALPIFTDEAIYIRWAQIAKQDASWRFISLVDGKQPMFTWIAVIMLKLVKEPLLSGRMVSVLAGGFSLIGMFFLGKELFKNTKIGLFSSFFYLIFPMALVYDRMALQDSLVATFTIWGLLFQVFLVRHIRLDLALILALIMGGGMLTKSNGFFTLYLTPFLLLLFNFSSKDKWKRLSKWGFFIAISVGLAYIYYSVLRLSPFFRVVSEKNALFVYSVQEWITHPLRFFYGNLVGVIDWLITYFTWPFILAVLVAFFIRKKDFRVKLFLVFWFISPFILLALFGKVLYPRFIFFMTMALIPLVAYTAEYFFTKIKRKEIFYTALIIVSFVALSQDYFILTNFAKAPIPASDRNQYNNDWTSGAGVKESVAFFKKEAEDKKIFIATQGTFGLMPFALEIYLVNNPNIKILGIWPIEDTPPKELVEASKIMPAYVVFYQPCKSCNGDGIGTAPKNWPVEKVLQIKKEFDQKYYTVYRMLP